MIRRPTLARAEPVHIPPRKTLPSAARVFRAAFLVIAATALIGIAHADVDVSDSKAQDKLDDIKSRLGDGDLNKTTSNVLKEIQTSVANLGFSATLTPGNQLQKISDTSGYVQQACPSQGGGALGAAAGAGGSSQNVTSIATISATNSSSIKQQICQQLIQLRVQAFNDSIEMANRFQQYSEQLTKIDNNRGSAKTQGDLWANTNESLRTIGKLQAEMGFWRTRLAAYEAAIKFHEGQQNALSQTAIKGSGGSLPSLGQLIQTGALAAALAIK
ncbi:hypothetical protein [Variovorax fucosicus]|uniref:hypothetical protein n=1 Tax=Variovorax fucosicus TaxID=3053517 RepID=UPI0025779E11|nr:hypothetical protein [Variovorax sp. J22G47]MDM0058394.1 hypothetical protein [Variovorax sp. J22G47]